MFNENDLIRLVPWYFNLYNIKQNSILQEYNKLFFHMNRYDLEIYIKQ